METKRCIWNSRVRAAAVAVCALAAMMVSACLFDARTPEPPAVDGGPIIPLESPERPFAAIKASLEKGNDVDYERAISEDFIFSPLPEDSLDQNLVIKPVYAGWIKQVELDVLNLILADNNVTVEFAPLPVINENTFVRFNTTYLLTLISKVVGDTTIHSGTSQVDVRNEGGNWRVTFWKDTSADDGVRSWGYLRGISRFRVLP